MVILIGGPSCVGKTTMAQRLLERYHITYLSIDHVKMGIYRTNPNCGFTPMDPDEKVSEYVWPIIREIIKTNIENDQNIIIEGCYLPTNEVGAFEEEYQRFIVSFYLIFSEEYLNNHFVDGILDHRSEVEYKDIDEYMWSPTFREAHRIQKERCIIDGQKFFEVSKDYTSELELAYQWVDERIQEKIQLRYNS